MKVLINIQNNDNEYFRWCLVNKKVETFIDHLQSNLIFMV